jgi:predicted membrane protein
LNRGLKEAKMRNPRSGKGLVGGLLIVAIGIIFLLDQQGIVSAGHVFRLFWPAFFIFLGLEDLLGGYDARKRTWGALLIAGGSLLLLDQLGFIHVRLGSLWPVLLIVVGVWVLLQNYAFGGVGPLFPLSHQPWHYGPRGPGGTGGPGGPYGPQSRPTAPTSGAPSSGTTTAGTPEGAAPPQAFPSPGFPPPPPASQGFQGGAMPQDPREWLRWHKWEARRQRRAWRHGWAGQAQPGGPASGFDSADAQFKYSAICSHVERNITAKNFKSGSISAIFGGFEIDLTRAEIEGDEAVIYAEAFFGGGEIRIPETWQVVIEASALFGAFMDETRQRPPEPGTLAKRLVIRGTAVFGGVSIEN